MAPSSTDDNLVRFGPFGLDLETGELHNGDLKVRLQQQPLEILTLLLERRGGLVTRDELRARLWSDGTIVDFDHSLNTAVRKLRQALDDDPDHPRFLETLPRRGYRLIVPVAPREEPPPEPAVRPEPSPARRILPSFGNTAIAAALLLGLLAGAYRLWNSRFGAAHPPKRVMLAVLPFENLTGNENQEYWSDGLTDEMITELARFDPARLGVIARSSVMKYKGASPDLAAVGRGLGVDYVLEGAVRSSPQRLRITVQLVRVRDQTQLWAEGYDASPADLLSVEYSVAERTADALSLKLLPAVQNRHASARPIKPEAREAYLRGRFLLSNGNSETFEQALADFEKAAEVEPDYAQAYAGIADAYILLGNYAILSRSEATPKAKSAALRALALDQTLTSARLDVADIRWEVEWDFAGARTEFRRAIEDNPNDAHAHQWYGDYLGATGDFDAAIAELKKATELDPISPHVGVDLGRAYYFARQYDLAIAQFRKVLELQPQFARAHSQLGLALLEKGQYDEALAELRTGMGEVPAAHSLWLGYAYARAGKEAEARRQLARQLEYWKQSHAGADAIALTYAGLGEKEQAFAWLEKDFESHGSVQMLKAWPYWDSLRSDPRYSDLLRRVGLPP